MKKIFGLITILTTWMAAAGASIEPVDYVNTLVESSGIKVLSVDGISPTPENLQSGSYPFTVNYYAVYRKGDTQTEAFVNWLISDEGQQVVAQAGYIPLH